MIRLTLSLVLSVSAVAVGSAMMCYHVYPDSIIFPIGVFLSLIASVVAGLSMGAMCIPEARAYMLNAQERRLKKNLKKAIGYRKYDLFLLIVVFTTCILAASAFVISANETSKQQGGELRKYGKVIRVEITDIYYRKGRRTAKFSFEYNNDLITHSVSGQNLQIGDSIEIIFSPRNPNLVRLAGDVEDSIWEI